MLTTGAFQAYFKAAQVAPLVMLKGRLARFRPRAVLLLVNASQPFEVMRDMGRKTDSVGFREQLQTAVASYDIGAMLLLSLEVVQLAASAVLLLAFLIGVPWIIARSGWRRLEFTAPLIVLDWFWLLYAALNGAYTLASFEGRYRDPAASLYRRTLDFGAPLLTPAPTATSRAARLHHAPRRTPSTIRRRCSMTPAPGVGCGPIYRVTGRVTAAQVNG